ncbi:hypothetical protein GCM10010103_26910 [Streptomyces paradoxus]|uniref:Uncharacterized protein n=1 Tax=Streptomyces paradoxus TaxID=66375 RepID=A0A7W9WG36_9ACTN|nr:hypothetical protein [Streptomyces paradoxus]MBB6076266.1 hypothetical protein [Streptomyces paradoxus]
MAPRVDNLDILVEGEIWGINLAEWSHDPDDPQPGKLTITVNNGTGNWIDVVMDSIYPDHQRIWTSGHFPRGQARTHEEEVIYHRDKTIKVNRWRPMNPFGIPRDAGGQLVFSMPDRGDVKIDITVIG